MLQEALEMIIETEKDQTLVNKARRMLKESRSGNKVCKLRKAIYGLRQAGRQWHAKLSRALESIGLVPPNSDPCVYVDKRKKYTYVLIYVDDILATKDNKRCTEIKNILSAEFQVKVLGPVKHCLGIEVNRAEDQISLCQSGYIREVLERFGMSSCKSVKAPMAPESRFDYPVSEEDCDTTFPYRELLGALMYIAIGTRPDIVHSVNKLSQFNTRNDETHWTAAKRILRYLKGTINKKLVFTRDNKKIYGYADADFGNCVIDR